MENKSSFYNALMVLCGVVTFVIGTFVPWISSEWKGILIISSPIILSLSCFYIFLKQNDDILRGVMELEDTIKKNNDLIDMKADIEYLKRKK